MSLTEKRKYEDEESKKAEQVGRIFQQIEILLNEAVSLGCSNGRMKLGLRHLLGKFTRDRVQ